jgi:hemerythrin-like domain-containing protein
LSVIDSSLIQINDTVWRLPKNHGSTHDAGPATTTEVKEASMPSAVNVIRSEHRSIAAVLHGLLYLIGEIRAGRSVARFDVLRAMVYYIDAFPERLHHPKEDRYLFAVLRERTREAEQALNRLEQQHRWGAELIRDIEQALLRYEQGGAEFFEEFAARVAEFADFHWKHMREEEDVILPLAERVLTAADWSAIDDAFAGNADPLIGMEARHSYEQLFTRIVLLAPPPVGVGDG